MTTIHIPSSLEDATKRLGAIEKLLTAKGWERAAIVAAFVELGEGRGKGVRNHRNRISCVQFAELGIAGLRTDVTVRMYVQRWLDTHDGIHPEPGAEVEVPTTPWARTRTGTDGFESTEGARSTIERIAAAHPEVIAEAVRRPEVADAVRHDGGAQEELTRQSLAALARAKDRYPGGGGGGRSVPTLGIQDHLGDAIGALEKSVARDQSLIVVAEMEKLQSAMGNFREHPWRPKEIGEVQHNIERVIDIGQGLLLLMKGISDDEIKGLLDR